MKSALDWVAVIIAGAVIVLVGLMIAELWISIGESEISAAGWLAMALGVIVTLALGIGLMTLVFISSRRGYDDVGRTDPSDHSPHKETKVNHSTPRDSTTG